MKDSWVSVVMIRGRHRKVVDDRRLTRRKRWGRGIRALRCMLREVVVEMLLSGVDGIGVERDGYVDRVLLNRSW